MSRDLVDLILPQIELTHVTHLFDLKVLSRGLNRRR
jgi:hypothetical protein